MKDLQFPVGISNFEKIREGGYYYIDKTNLISELLSGGIAEVTLITRPRRFGKSLGMSTLANFLDIRKDNKQMFEGLAISKKYRALQEMDEPVSCGIFLFQGYGRSDL